MRTKICELFGIEFPILAFTHCRDVVAAVTRAGGYGVLGAAGHSPEELDIDLRLTDLWREAADVGEWNLEIVAAFMRAAYGKGYCDALTEDSPGSLCEEHGYRIPDRRRPAPTREG